MLERVLRVLEGAIEAVGQVVAWFVVGLTIALTYEALARLLFVAPTVWAYDVTYMLYGAHFMLGAAYTLRRGGHVRTDFLYERLPEVWQRRVDTICYLLFYFGPVLALLWFGSGFALEAWRRAERAITSPWMPVIYPFKTVIPVAAILLLVQGLVEFVRNLGLAGR